MAESPVRPVGRRRFLAGVATAWLGSSVLTACGSAGSTSSAAGSSAAGVAPERITYGDDPSQFGDLWAPVGEGPFPVLVLIHGGFWRASFDLTLMDDLAMDAVSRRWAVWNIEYRRVGQDGGGWPGTFADVAAAIDHLATVVDGGAVPLDLDRVAVAGHSAGGHLAAWAATRPSLPGGAPGAAPRIRPVAVISQAGVLDLVAAADEGIGASSTVDLMGATPSAEPDRYALGSPIERVPTGVPIRCVHGRQDDIVPIDQSERYVAAAEAQRDPAVLAPFDGTHFDVLDPGHESWAAATAWLRPYLQP